MVQRTIRKLDLLRLEASWAAAHRIRRNVPVALPPASQGQAVSLVAPLSAERLDNAPLGIVFMVIATLLFAVSSAIAKWAVAAYPIGEVMFVRSFASLVACAALVLPIAGLSVFATGRPGAHVARGLRSPSRRPFR
jgi:hypothetical protein